MANSINIKHHGSLGVLWLIGWLFSIGFLKLGFWKGFLALFVWPYFLGSDFAPLRAVPATQSDMAVESSYAGIEQPWEQYHVEAEKRCSRYVA